MKRVIVSGATGFLGRTLCKSFMEKDIEVFAIVRTSKGRIAEELKDKGVQIIECLLEDIRLLDLKMTQRDFDVFYHLAWDGVYGEKSIDYELQAQNICYTCEAVKVSKKLGCKKFIFPGSIMEYACMRGVSTNGARPGLRNIYYGAKQAAHILAKTLSVEYEVDYIEAVISNIYGPEMSLDGFINCTLLKMIKNEQTAFTSGEQEYDFIYITDALEIFYLLGEFGKSLHTYYVGSLESKKMKEYIKEMKKYANYDKEIGLGKILNTTIDIVNIDIDKEKIYKEIGYKPLVSFKEGINFTIQWLKGQD